jgi:hypothetical protein
MPITETFDAMNIDMGDEFTTRTKSGDGMSTPWKRKYAS